ncbi:MAG: hypothetical protein LC776_16415, partial [Acidobacteria bacterium]|nr:hypothetical protein [Acidobacteriota bacterium]
MVLNSGGLQLDQLDEAYRQDPDSLDTLLVEYARKYKFSIMVVNFSIESQTAVLPVLFPTKSQSGERKGLIVATFSAPSFFWVIRFELFLLLLLRHFGSVFDSLREREERETYITDSGSLTNGLLINP